MSSPPAADSKDSRSDPTPDPTPDPGREPSGAQPGVLPNNPPEVRAGGAPGDPATLVIEARPRDLGGFSVRRALPARERRLVGPFIFFDHIGPADFAPGHGIEVRPHPHIGLATLTYLFAGEIVHRDSLGSHQVIRAGDVNWMLAGRGIVHSERTDPELRRRGAALHGIQSWIALPTADEESTPEFAHHPGSSIPHLTRDGATLDLVMGTAYGATSPVEVRSPTLYLAVRLEAGATLSLPDEHPERALYLAEGRVACGERQLETGSMIVFRPGAADVRALAPSRLIVIGGAPLDGQRHIYWNFVASTRERIERAKADWKAGRFDVVPGDEHEFIPLPEE
jgi:redox-sensitive bicupin YhaK (pirin superfamily)